MYPSRCRDILRISKMPVKMLFSIQIPVREICCQGRCESLLGKLKASWKLVDVFTDKKMYVFWFTCSSKHQILLLKSNVHFYLIWLSLLNSWQLIHSSASPCVCGMKSCNIWSVVKIWLSLKALIKESPVNLEWLLLIFRYSRIVGIV